MISGSRVRVQGAGVMRHEAKVGRHKERGFEHTEVAFMCNGPRLEHREEAKVAHRREAGVECREEVKTERREDAQVVCFEAKLEYYEAEVKRRNEVSLEHHGEPKDECCGGQKSSIMGS
ncbi:hypothetical protein A0H81_02486 [Grifola frondosa]|uniref:Uncharacterized protein n=1 Tax=Grifola frondosa TaxID=5627 RepID=A0A1C7MMV9_GRIFR|nr:hypothetical protein A0H81_02486 [Grifola frondosa]